MEICRACLLTEQDMVSLDEFCVSSYMLLTNLKISLNDDKPQYFCQNCFDMIKIFIDFREKAISSDIMLQDISENTKPDVDNIKVENYYDDNYYASSDEAINNNQKDTYNEVNLSNAPMKIIALQCVLCQKKFTDNIRLIEHLREHKRGAKCKICLEKVLLADLYSHTLQHLQHMVPPEQGSDSHQVKVEVPEDCKEPHFDRSAANYNHVISNLQADTVKAEQKTKSAVKKKNVKLYEAMQQKLLHCGLCNMKFDSKELLINHLESHKYIGTSTCKLCQEVFISWPELFGHRFSHLPGKQRRCHICSRRCFSENQMEFHYRNEHYDGEDKFLRCKECLRTYAGSRQLSKHIRSIHGEKRFICDHCNKSCTTKSQLVTHLASHGGGQLYVCDICGFSCKLKSGLRNHKMRHYPDKIKCGNCERTFLDRAKADEHKLNCKPRSVICPTCGKEFSKPRLLTRHQVMHSPTKAYKCDRCPATFRSRQNLKIHLDRHDGNRTRHCEYCGASFYSSSVLIKHRRVHTGEKPYVCKICNRGFTGRHNLKVHMRVHGEDLIVKKTTLTGGLPPPI